MVVMMNNRSVVLSIVLALNSGCFAGLLLDPTERTISWDDTDYTWSYDIASGDWSWTSSLLLGDRTWSYNGITKVFIDEDSGERWHYDQTHDVWVNAPSNSYAIETATTYDHQAWRFVEDTGRWHPVTRAAVGDDYTFSTASSVYWEYDVDSNEWTYVRSVTGTPVVPTNQVWVFNFLSLSWQEQEELVSWRYNSNFVSGQWQSQQTNLWWRFQDCTDTQSRWDIVGYDPEFPWDLERWTLSLSSGAWTSTLVRLDPATLGTVRTWQYDSGDALWHNVADEQDVQDIVPLFAPTPFAYYKAVIESTVNTLLGSGISFGSSDGTGAGLLSQSDDTVLHDGVFVFDDITQATLTDVVTISGDIELQVLADATIIVGDGVVGHDVVIKPATGAPYAQIIFNVAVDTTLEIQLLNDCYFKAGTNLPLYVSFRGKGTTVFRMPSGRILSFGPASDLSSAYGVAVQVVMDLSEQDIAAGVDQVVFEPWSYVVDEVNTRLDKTTKIMFGRSSSLRFFSYDEFGIDGTDNGYGSIAFDVSHAGTGRTILDLAAGVTPGDRYDAGINIWGSLVVPSDEVVSNVDLREQTFPHRRAGVLALINIVDNLAFDAVVDDADNPSLLQAASWVARGADDRRGLVVLNHNKSYPHLASNLARAQSLQQSQWAITQKDGSGYQPGCVIGDNGQIRIAHNLFLDYVACSTNQVITPTVLAGAGATTAQVKRRNPSAFIVDEVGFYADSSENEEWDMQYAGDRRASMILEGTAGCFFRAGASSLTGNPINEIVTRTTGAQELDTTIGVGLYDGNFCPVLDGRGVQSLHESILVARDGNPLLYDEEGVRCFDGEQVIDIEGEFGVISVLGRFGFAPNGYINIPSIAIDHTGKEKDEVTL